MASNKLTYKDDKITWYPAPISRLEEHLCVVLVPCHHLPPSVLNPTSKNIAYNLQYIEFLDRLIKDIKLSSVLWTQNIKSFIIHSAAVIESIFHYVVISTGHANVIEWKSCNKFKSNPYEINGSALLCETEIFIKSEDLNIADMTFDQLAKKVESHKLLGNVNDLYKEISKIRKLRNKIHLYGVEHPTDTDFMTFGKSEYELTRRVLLGVLVCPLFDRSKCRNYFDYLKIS
ncbi:MAG: hypothetical protein LLF28_05000 [Nitrospiraceae bacterium]|nr:hypothetical protein [Nitrospiraceae bacterium]